MQARIALAGNPNSGKTTLFNALTGARQHVGNYPGVTVEKKQGTYAKDGLNIEIVDLPGTYSLSPYSMEEAVARDFLLNEKPAMVIDILDASNLQRNLYLAIQLMEMGLNVCLALNMIDIAGKRGIEIDAKRLSDLMGIPVVPTVARTGKGRQRLMEAASKASEHVRPPLMISYGDDLDQALDEMEGLIRERGFLRDICHPRWIALNYLENDEKIISRGRENDPELSAILDTVTRRVADHLGKTMNTSPESVIADHRHGYIRSIIKEVVTNKHDHNRFFLSDRIDMVLTSRFVGPLIMIGIIMALYTFTFTYSELPVAWLEGLFGWLSSAADRALPDGLVKSLIISGIIDGVGGVLGFVPLIMFMFLGISLLEDTGYLARMAYMLDRVFRYFGLHGSSVMAFIVSGGIAGGCAVPGVMATRTLRSPKERLATLLTAPFMNCGAKLPVFALLVAAFFPENEAMIMLIITMIAWCGALVVAKILRLTIIKGESAPFVMELPPYHLPTFKGLFIHTWERTWQYIKKAGTVILGISIILWAMMTCPSRPESPKSGYDAQRQLVLASAPSEVIREMETIQDSTLLSKEALDLKYKIAAIDRAENEAGIKFSLAGRIGVALEGISRLAGFDWRTNIALVGGLAAKEVVVSTLGTVYSLGEIDPEESSALSETLSKSPHWSPLAAWSLIIFTIFYAPCFVAVVCIAREAGSWKWGAFSVVFNTLLAFGLSATVFQTGRLLGF